MPARYLHMDMEDLEKRLVETRGARLRLIATDGVSPAAEAHGSWLPLCGIYNMQVVMRSLCPCQIAFPGEGMILTHGAQALCALTKNSAELVQKTQQL